MENIELFERARNRVQKKIKGRCVTNKDVIIDQEKEIQYYRERIQKLTNISDSINSLDKKIEISINKEDYLIKYKNGTDNIILNSYLIKLVYEKDKYIIEKTNEFRIINKTRYNKSHDFEFIF